MKTKGIKQYITIRLNYIIKLVLLLRKERLYLVRR